MADSRSAAERYLSARRSSHLRVQSGRCAADVLLAAGFASHSSSHKAAARKSAALAVYGVLASENMAGAWALADEMSGWLRKKSYQSRTRDDPGVIERVAAIDLAMVVLKWWHHPTCPTCNGLGHPLRPDAPVIDSTRQCTPCHGTGQIPIERLVKPEHIELARWLSEEIRVMVDMVFGDIARRLNADMELS